MTDDVQGALAASPGLAPWLDGVASGRLWIAFSGGLDSTVLLYALRGVDHAAAIHVDHGINPDSAAWSCHCAALAARFGVAIETRRLCIDPAGNLPAAARRARYAAWRELLNPGDVLVLAHHADDQAETRLWQLFTGRRPGGMPVARSLGGGRLLRPLLSVRRRRLADYARRHGLHWIEDPANTDAGFDRSYIRHHLLPAIEARFPGVVERLAAPRRPTVPPQPLAAAVAATTVAGVEAWLLAAGLATADAVVAEIHRQSLAACDRNPRVSVAPGVHAWRYGRFWHLVRRSRAAMPGQCAAIAGRDLTTPLGALVWRRGEMGLPGDLALCMRRRLGGERIRPSGRGVSKSVKALFQEQRVPPWQRETWPLLYDDAGRLVALPGLAIAAEAAVAGGWRPRWTPGIETLTVATELGRPRSAVG